MPLRLARRHLREVPPRRQGGLHRRGHRDRLRLRGSRHVLGLGVDTGVLRLVAVLPPQGARARRVRRAPRDQRRARGSGGRRYPRSSKAPPGQRCVVHLLGLLPRGEVEAAAEARGPHRLGGTSSGDPTSGARGGVPRGSQMLAECCPGAARVMEAEPSPTLPLAFPDSHWTAPAHQQPAGAHHQPRDQAAQPPVVQVSSRQESRWNAWSEVLCDVDEWGGGATSRRKRWPSLYADKPAPEPFGKGGSSPELRAIAKRAIEADLRLADEMESA